MDKKERLEKVVSMTSNEKPRITSLRVDRYGSIFVAGVDSRDEVLSKENVSRLIAARR